MGILSTLRHELLDVIEWLDESHRTLVWRFPRYQNTIKHGAQLIVRPGQSAVFVDQGQVADVFPPGQYRLDTQNLPIISTLQAWAHGFESPFKCEVYFVSTTVITDLKWGTPNPIMFRDKDFGPIRLRAFGNYSLRAIDPRALLRELVGTDGIFDVSEVSELLRNMITSAFAEVLGTSQLSALDIAAHYDRLGDAVRDAVCERIDDEYGLELPALQIANITLPEEAEQALDTRTRMNVIGDMNKYRDYLAAQSIPHALDAKSGAVGTGMALGVGVAMAGQLSQMFIPKAPAGPAAVPPASPPPLAAATPAAWHIAPQGQALGPLTLEQVWQCIDELRVTATTLVWTQGMSSWAPAGGLDAFRARFERRTPPPLPAS
jgi:membrane protease subunit (stomatin/prohibitin family)